MKADSRQRCRMSLILASVSAADCATQYSLVIGGRFQFRNDALSAGGNFPLLVNLAEGRLSRLADGSCSRP